MVESDWKETTKGEGEKAIRRIKIREDPRPGKIEETVI